MPLLRAWDNLATHSASEMATRRMSMGCCNSSSRTQPLTTLGSPEQTQSFDDHVWQFEDGVTWTHGRHNLKVRRAILAPDYQDLLCRQQWPAWAYGFRRKVYQRVVTSSVAGTGDGGADFVLGLPFNMAVE